MERLQLLMSVHSHFVDAAGLPENTRPYSVQSRLETIQRSIMKELDKLEGPSSPPASPPTSDN